MTAVIPLAAIWVINPKQSLKNRDFHNFQSETRDTDVSDRKGQKSLEIGGCFAVSDETPENAGSGKVVGVNI